jgi:polyisoprenoid-binding protein YceI
MYAASLGIRGSWGGSTARRWWVGTIAVVGLLIAAIGVASVWFVISPAAAAPLALPAAAAAPAGPLDGTWAVAGGSVAGFRVRASAFGIGNDVVGRTPAVSGTITVARDWVVGARLRVALAGIRVDGKTEPQLLQSLRTDRYPVATFSLTEVAAMGPGFAAGRTVTRQVHGFLFINGTACGVTVTITARRSGSALEVAGAMPVEFSYWGIQAPPGAGILGSLADSGTAEFSLVLHRQQ